MRSEKTTLVPDFAGLSLTTVPGTYFVPIDYS